MSHPGTPHLPRTLVNRALAIDGVINFRDLGGGVTNEGRPVLTGRVFRSASLDTVTDQGLRALESIGIRTVIDLRSHDEVERHGRFPYERSPVQWLHLASNVGPPSATNPRRAEMMGHPDPMSLIYREVITGGGAILGDALRALARDDSHPVVFHCTSGKDRTGLLAVLVNLIIGVPLEAALVDFEYSARELEAVRADMTARYPEMATVPPEVLDRMAGVDRTWVLDALGEVGALERPETWLDSIGVDGEVRRALRHQLVG